MNKRTLKVKGSAEVSAAPDLVVITFDLASKNFDYGKCLENLSSQTESLREDLASIGLERDSLKTARFNINTDFRWDRQRDRQIFQGYQASHVMRVEFPFEKDYLGKVLHVLSRAESEASFRISFQIKDPEPLRQQAIAGAVKNSREKALVLADAAGVSLGDIVQIDYSWSEIRFETDFEVCEVDAQVAAPSYDITPEDVDVSDSVTVIWEIK